MQLSERDFNRVSRGFLDLYRISGIICVKKYIYFLFRVRIVYLSRRNLTSSLATGREKCGPVATLVTFHGLV